MSIDLLRAIEDLPSTEVMVVGDLILDRYVCGHVGRISPEAPIQVLREEESYERLGGMGSVARNLVRLGARVRLAGMVGDDTDGRTILDALEAEGVRLDGLVLDPERPTTIKTRYVAASQHARQQILRVDRESDGPPSPVSAERILAGVRSALHEVEILVMSDYAKGVLAGDLCREVLQVARSAGVKVLVDPKGTDFERYRGATGLTPNRAEASVVTGLHIESPDDAQDAARDLLERFDLEVVFITLDRDGIFVLERDAPGTMIGTEPREVYDVTGAGDNVISVLACAMAGGVGPVTAAALANVAGGIAVEHFGVVSVGWDEIAARIAAGSGGDAKLVDVATLQLLLDSARQAGRKVVFTNGCFDILHPGHVDLLTRARAFGDLLVVGVNEDASVRRLKGPSRPVNDLRARAAVLGGLAAVDYVVGFGEDTPERIIKEVRPDILVKGSDWADKGVVGREFVESYGGRVELIQLVPGHSTTAMLDRMEGKS
jgi:D-beta-D-heptose 7-phosphate kinase/D-beta-D-heptose 1-phosphate adenosyltransferase